MPTKEQYAKNPERYKRQASESYFRNRERSLATTKIYNATPEGYKIQTIGCWKKRGINCDEEWDEVYDWWLNVKTCDICDKEFEKSRNKCLDHDHTLEGYNVRGILCKKCNNYQNEL